MRNSHSFCSKWMLSLSLLMASGYCMADNTCSPSVYDAANKFLGIHYLSPPNQDGGSVVTATCKIWPHDKSLTIVAIAFDPNDDTSDTGKNTLIALLDNRTNTIVNSVKDFVVEDASTEFGADSYSIDTAPYNIASNNRAFGVRFNSAARGPSCADANSSDDTTLYLPSNRELKPVLQLSLSQVRAFSGCIGSYSEKNRGEFANISLSIENTSTNGLRDIRARASINTYNAQETQQQNASLKIRKESYVFKYDGKTYKPSTNKHPWWLGYY